MYIRKIVNRIAPGTMRLTVFSVNILAFIIAIALFIKAAPILNSVSLGDLLLSSNWYPLQGEFGFFPFIVGTIEVTALAMIFAIPVCLLSAIYLSEYANRRMRALTRLLIDIMAGIPSVVYGLCGIIVIVPFVQQLGESIGRQTTGYSLLAGSIVLAIMVTPFIISLSMEVMRTVPMEARESALSLGSTKWEVVKHVVLRSSLKGIAAAIVLGVSRAFGETMAVMMVVGNVASVPASIFDPAYPLPALIANNYGEMMSIPLYDSALLLAALVLMMVVGVFSVAAHLTLMKVAR